MTWDTKKKAHSDQPDHKDIRKKRTNGMGTLTQKEKKGEMNQRVAISGWLLLDMAFTSTFGQTVRNDGSIWNRIADIMDGRRTLEGEQQKKKAVGYDINISGNRDLRWVEPQIVPCAYSRETDGTAVRPGCYEMRARMRVKERRRKTEGKRQNLG